MKELTATVCITLCIQIILGLTQGSSFHKYVKLFGYLIVMFVCFSMFFAMWNDYALLADEKMHEIEESTKAWMQWR